jgi:hypothetical protein
MSELTNDTQRLEHMHIESTNRLNTIMDNWCNQFSTNYQEGKMRSSRGNDIETFVSETINIFGRIFNKNLVAIKGASDKKALTLTVNGKEITKYHQVDIHVYLDNRFIAIIECKAYLDSCYYVRACDDFKLFRKFGYSIKNYIFTLENSIDDETKHFTDHVSDYICDEVFCMLDGKRSPSKPIYDSQFKKIINANNLTHFIDTLYRLCSTSDE